MDEGLSCVRKTGPHGRTKRIENRDLNDRRRACSIILKYWNAAVPGVRLYLRSRQAQTKARVGQHAQVIVCTRWFGTPTRLSFSPTLCSAHRLVEAQTSMAADTKTSRRIAWYLGHWDQQYWVTTATRPSPVRSPMRLRSSGFTRQPATLLLSVLQNNKAIETWAPIK